MSDLPLRVLLSHTSDFGARPAQGNSYIDAAFRALDRAQAVVTDMSLLPASGSSPKQVSEALAKDTDLYVGIIGWRFGSPVRESPEVSYTQLEFRAAADAGVPRLVFLLDEKRKSKDAGEPNFERQLAFRNEITESGITVQRFDSPEKLSTALFHSIWKPPGWDPAFLRMFLHAADSAAARGGLLAGRAIQGVSLTARPAGSSETTARDLDPLELAAEVDRLVVLGGPGTGKSWLARQVARRAAQTGLVRLAKREPLDKIELPLLVPISPFFSLAERAPSIWEALVTQAVKELEPFLPNHRCLGRIRRVLAPRDDRYFLILEGLDEAAQLQTTTARQLFDALIHDNCRLMVTSRPGRWHGQIAMTPPAGARKLRLATIELQPLEPGQVRRLVRDAAQEAKDADALLEFLRGHPSLAQAARVPLIAQLVAIAGPARTLHDVYDRAINHILRGPWRATEPGESLSPYRAARSLVEEWAWQAALEQNDPVSGLADWTAALAVNFSASDPAVRSAVDNVCPVVEQDLTRLLERRQFLHRAIREHLVADRIASLSLDQAAAALEPHLWYDDIWHSIVPAAVAAHKEPTALLRRLLVGDIADPEDGMAAFRARDGLGELGDMLARLHREAGDSIWAGDPVLQPIVRSCLQNRGVSLAPDPAVQERVPGREQVARWLRAGELPMRDVIAPQIRAAAFDAAERSDLAEAVRRRLVGDRLLSAGGTLLWRHHLAMAFEALQPDEAALLATRSRLIELLGDVRRTHEADEILAAILILRPTDADRQAIAPLAIAALKSVEDAWHRVDLARSLMSVALTPEQKGALRDALRAGIDREPTSTWTRELLRAFGSTQPAAGEVAACVSRALASRAYRQFDSHDRNTVYGGLRELTTACPDQDVLLREIVRHFRAGGVDHDRSRLVEEIVGHSSPGAQLQTAHELVASILEDRDRVYGCVTLLRLLKPPSALQQTVVDQLLELLQAPDAPWATIGEEVATLDATESQRFVAAEHLLSVLANEPDLAVKLRAASTLVLLRPDEEQGQRAQSLLRAEGAHWAGRNLAQLIRVLAALRPGGSLEPADLRLIVDELERHRLDGTSLGFGWAKTLVDLEGPDSDLRRQLVAVTLIPADRLEDVGFIPFNDRLIDAGILAGDYEVPKRLVGDACIDVLRRGEDAFSRGELLLEPEDIEAILDRLSQLGLPRDQQVVAAGLAAGFLRDLAVRDRDQGRVTRACRAWRALAPPEDMVRDLAGLLIETVRNAESTTEDRTGLLSAVLELEPPSEQRSQVAEIIVERVLAGHKAIDSYIVGRVTISADGLRRLVGAAKVPGPILGAAASSTRRSMPIAGWKALLPDLGRGETSIEASGIWPLSSPSSPSGPPAPSQAARPVPSDPRKAPS